MRFSIRDLLWLTLLAAVLVVGCSTEVKPRTASGLVSAWADLGMNLPAEEDIAFIRERLPDSLAALRSGLAHDDEHVRMSSAYVAEKLGPQAGPLVSTIIEKLQSEPAPVIRVYLASALAEIGQVDSSGIRRLEDGFTSEKHEQAKTHIAGALVRLCSPQAEPAAWQWLLQSLEAFPPEPPADLNAAQVFWERRWGAVKHVRIIRGKDDVLLPLLVALKSNPKTPRWVIDQQVAEAVMAIERRTKRSTE
ncbi:MAG TPA: hypothetical protein VMP01_03155 [Pirellulaceae bacterium]|nr:hypothetical protein [Pirellulaceae bacterium]